MATCKSSLTPDTILVLLDFFPENYSFIVQDTIEGHHWDNSQASLHPSAVYYIKDGHLECLSIMSRQLQQDDYQWRYDDITHWYVLSSVTVINLLSAHKLRHKNAIGGATWQWGANCPCDGRKLISLKLTRGRLTHFSILRHTNRSGLTHLCTDYQARPAITDSWVPTQPQHMLSHTGR